MAGHWIKWEKGLLNKPEIIRMATFLKKNRKEVAATCMTVWEWADDITTNGVVDGVPESCIDEIAGLPGFATAMCDVGWLISDKTGITFPNFDRHNGQTAKERAVTNRRVAHWRAVTHSSLQSRYKTRNQRREE